MKALINAKTYDFIEYKTDQYILFDKEIIEIGFMKDYKNQKYEEIDASNMLVMPGLVNGHSHIYSTFSRGLNVEYNPQDFEEILKQLWWKIDRNITNKITYYSGIVSGVEYLKNGVTTIIDHHASGEILGSLEQLRKAVSDQVGLRGIYCFESSDRFNIDECIEENNAFINSNKSDRSRGLFGLHAQFTLSDDSLKKISSKLNTPIHIHVAESKLDQDRSMIDHNQRVVERLHSYNLIKKDSILTHCLYLDDHELKIIQDQKAVVAFNVTSNMNNGVGLPNYNQFKEWNIPVIIGNDGISNSMTTEYRNLFFTMHHKGNSPTAFSYNDLIEIISNTYEYVSRTLKTKLGRIKKGYQADILLLPFNPIAPINSENIFGYLLFGDFQHFHPMDVFIRGNRILKDYQVSKKLQKHYNKSSKYAKELWNSIEKEGTL